MFIGLGSNLGARRGNLVGALTRLGDHEHFRLVRWSALYQTSPVGGPEQGDFLNAVAEVRTSLSPSETLAALRVVEAEHGRLRGPAELRWGPRTLDLDILLYDDSIVSLPELEIPHPRLAERRFVLEPLAELAADRVHPDLRRSIGELRDRLAGSEERVVRIACPIKSSPDFWD